MNEYEKDIIDKYGYAISRTQSAKIMGISIATFDRYTRDGIIKHTKVAGSVKVTPKTIVAFLGLAE